MNQRGIAGRININHLEKRVIRPISFLGGCALATPPSNPVYIPGIPKVNAEILGPELSGSLRPQFSVISRYDRATDINCVPTTTRLDASSFANAPQWIGPDGTVAQINNLVSLDHACK